MGHILLALGIQGGWLLVHTGSQAITVPTPQTQKAAPYSPSPCFLAAYLAWPCGQHLVPSTTPALLSKLAPFSTLCGCTLHPESGGVSSVQEFPGGVGPSRACGLPVCLGGQQARRRKVRAGEGACWVTRALSLHQERDMSKDFGTGSFASLKPVPRTFNWVLPVCSFNLEVVTESRVC